MAGVVKRFLRFIEDVGLTDTTSFHKSKKPLNESSFFS